MNNLKQEVYNYNTKYKEGFIESEILDLLNKYKIEPDKFNRTLGVHTVMRIDNQFITFHGDVYNTIVACLDNRELNLKEWV